MGQPLSGTPGFGSAYIISRKARHALFAHTDWSYLRRKLGVAVRDRGNVLPEGFRPPCAGGKDLCGIHADNGRRRGIPRNHEASTEQCRGRDSNVLSDWNWMADRQAQRRGNQWFRLGCASDSFDARDSHLDEWDKNRAKRSWFTGRSSRRDDLLYGFCDAARCRGRHSHAGGCRCCWSKAHRAASLAHVLWAVHRGGVFFPGTLEPPIEIAFGSGARTTSAPGSIQHDVVFNSQHSPTDYADFLASPSALPKCVQGLNATCGRTPGSNAIACNDSAQAFDQIEVGEVAYVGIGIPAGVGSDVKYVGVVDAGAVCGDQIPPWFFLAGQGVIAVQLQGNFGVLGSDDVSPKGYAPRRNDVGNFSGCGSRFSAVNGIESQDAALLRNEIFSVFGRKALDALGSYWSERCAIHISQIGSLLLSGLFSSNEQVLAIGKPQGIVIVEARLGEILCFPDAGGQQPEFLRLPGNDGSHPLEIRRYAEGSAVAQANGG